MRPFVRSIAILLVVIVWSGCNMCGGKKTPIATLEKADGPIDRQAAGEPAWAGAAVGAQFFLGDAARTADAGAQLALAGGAQIAMQKHTVLRFGGKAGQSRISVELGAIDLSGTGNYDLDIGAVKLGTNGKVRITARGGGKAEVKLTFGDAQVTSLEGQTIELKLDLGVTLGDAEVKPVADAGVADAVPDAAEPPDAPPPIASGATIDVTGKKGEILIAGETKWAPLPEGASDLPKGAKIRLGGNTTAKLASGGTSLALGGGSRAALSETLAIELEVGSGTLSGEGQIGLPGGAIALKVITKDPSDIKLDSGGGGMKVTIARGAGRLTGTGGSQLDMARGESATLLKNGQIRPLEAIPGYFDMRITAGEGNFTIHDPRPPVAIQFQFGGKCPDGGIIELDRDPRFRTAKVSGGKEAANHLLKTGSWSYRLRCSTGAGEGTPVASGRIAVIADGGTRKLPDKPGVSPFSPNGMLWTIGYQSVIPDIAVTFPGAGSNFELHLARGGKDTTFSSKSTKLKIEGKQLSEGTYTYWFNRDGVRQDKTNSLKIQFDNTAPQVYIELPVNGKPWGAGDVDVRGSVVPGWTAAVDTAAIPLDGARRFIAKVQQPFGRALAIKLSHPQRGVHYYLRRGGN
jgi:hypothetical protein